jgi:hypothetical protein
MSLPKSPKLPSELVRVVTTLPMPPTALMRVVRSVGRVLISEALVGEIVASVSVTWAIEGEYVSVGVRETLVCIEDLHNRPVRPVSPDAELLNAEFKSPKLPGPLSIDPSCGSAFGAGEAVAFPC